MGTEIKTCYIYSEDDSRPAIFLPDNKEVFVGRNIESKITDTQCSRRQVRLFANYADQSVSVQQIGNRSSGLNGFKIDKDVKIVAQHNDRLEILYGKYPYTIEFNPPPVKQMLTSKEKKRAHESDSESNDNNLSEKKIKKESSLDSNEDSLNFSLPSTCSNSQENCLLETKKKILKTDKNLQPTDKEIWEEFGRGTCLVFTSNGVIGRSKIAAYDMDKTLIKTKSGLEFPKDANDWQLWHHEVPNKLKKLHADNFKIIIFTNQASLGTGKIKVSDFKLKIERIVKKIGTPIQVFIAVGHSRFRKPCTGMWELLSNEKNDGVLINKEQSLFVGDAAGRPAHKDTKRKKDHSLADRLLAMNLGLQFHTPEEHFLGHKPSVYNPPVFHPKEEMKKKIEICDPPNAEITSKEQEIIVMVGCPGSGKSHFVKTYLTDYKYVNRDTLGSWQKCVAETERALVQGKSVVVDNTNPDELSRQRYVDVAKKRKVQVRCFVMAANKEHTKHNNKFRCLTDPTHEKISDIIINSYIKNFKVPSLEEGFKEVVKINFVPKFQSDEHRKLYEMYLLEN
ncbi:uncharacterized protein F21D5.5 isoform X2 [Leptopilina heterotoma]|uniref:uncharacterized protein F21D5.5 isoform X2 n=1 Tax=Leptopilina heterotoma TaxID=63436 RepID=UPI001CA818A0|nr:uncharacterized protein F21D5.5 isoform X2 [Leptopilina heterotoma]